MQRASALQAYMDSLLSEPASHVKPGQFSREIDAACHAGLAKAERIIGSRNLIVLFPKHS